MKDKILDKIQKCLRLSEGAGTEAEAETAAVMAQKLMTQHKIEMSEVEGFVIDDASIEIEEVDILEGTKQKQPTSWQRQLLAGCAQGFYCRTVFKPSRRFYKGYTSKGGLCVYGKKEDVAACLWLYNWLCKELESLVKRRIQDPHVAFHCELTNESLKKWAGGFRLGFAFTVAVRLGVERRKSDAELKENPTCNALVLINSEADQIQKWSEDRYGSLRNGPSMKVGSNSGYASGSLAGNQVDLSARKDKFLGC